VERTYRCPGKQLAIDGGKKLRELEEGDMANKRTVEVFSAGCPACEDAVQLVRRLACDSCDVRVLNMNDAEVSERARELGIRSVPAVAVDGELAACCRGQGPTEEDLRAAGIGEPLS
jgi:glutaredoxin 3